ncbi:MAG: ABC transporter substrate-binding protein [Anaerolineae bacterium]
MRCTRTASLHSAILTLCALTLVLSGCGSARSVTTAQQVTRIVYGLTLEPSGIDPHINASSELGIPLRSVYDTLVYRDPSNGQFVPGLAESWDISTDGLSYTFHLKQGITFHDGTPFNAQAIAANLDRITNPETASQKAAYMLGSYDHYEVVDDSTIRLVLSEPYSPLMDSLSQVYLGIASPTALNAVSNERYQFHQVGTGPFEFVEYLPGERITLRRNPHYTWGPSFYTIPSEASIDEIEFRFYTDAASRAIALESGDVQVMGEIPPTDARALSANPAVQIMPVNIPGQPLQFLINTARFPTDSLQVRQALLFATNREAIVDSVFQRYSPIAWGPLAANTGFYSSQVVGAYNNDPTTARSLLEQAGFIDADSNGYYDAPDGDLSVTLIMPGWGFIPEVSQLLQDQWRQIGIRAILDSAPSRSLVVDRVNDGSYNLVAFYSFGDDPSLLNDYFLSGGSLNWTHYQDSSLDNLLLDAVRQSDPAARSTDYTQVQRTLLEQAIVLPIRDYVNLNGVSTRIQGLTFDAYGWFPLLNNITVSGG